MINSDQHINKIAITVILACSVLLIWMQWPRKPVIHIPVKHELNGYIPGTNIVH